MPRYITHVVVRDDSHVNDGHVAHVVDEDNAGPRQQRRRHLAMSTTSTTAMSPTSTTTMTTTTPASTTPGHVDNVDDIHVTHVVVDGHITLVDDNDDAALCHPRQRRRRR
jgi:hypothetical protein